MPRDIVAGYIECYVNEEFKKGRRSFTYDEIEREIGENLEMVEWPLIPLDCGRNGITLFRKNDFRDCV